MGQIRCIFFAEFHPIKGPEIRCQAHTNPKDKVTKDIFEAISVFVIPKPQLGAEYVLNIFSHPLKKTCHQRKTKCLLFNF